MSVRINIDTSDWDSKSTHLQDGLRVLPRRVLEEGSAIIEEELRGVVPIRTGKLQKSVMRLAIADVWAVVGTTSGYGRYVDEGTRFFTGRNFKKRAMANAVPKLFDAVKRILQEEAGFR